MTDCYYQFRENERHLSWNNINDKLAIVETLFIDTPVKIGKEGEGEVFSRNNFIVFQDSWSIGGCALSSLSTIHCHILYFPFHFPFVLPPPPPFRVFFPFSFYFYYPRPPPPPVFFLLFLLTGNFRQWNITFNSTKKQAFLFSCSAKIRETCDSEGSRLEAAATINIPFDLSIRRISAIVGPPSENKSNQIPLSFFLSLPLKIDR